jgi:hypothetical protein
MDQFKIVLGRFDLSAEHGPWRESVNGPTLRTLLAGLIGIAASFGGEADEFPPSAADASEFRAQARPQPSAQPRLSDLAVRCGSGRFALTAGGRTRWRDLTVEVEHVLETP